MALALDLDLEMFAALGAFTGGEQTVISPWYGADSTVTDPVRARLVRAGAIDGDGAGPRLRSTLAALAAATATTTLGFTGPGVLVDYAVWASAHHGAVGLSATSDGGLRLEDPAPCERVIDFVTALVGQGLLRGLDVRLNLSLDDAYVLAAMVDLQRRRILSGLATGQPVTDAEGPVDVAQLSAELNRPPAPAISLLETIRLMSQTDPARAARGLSEALARLAGRGLVEADSSGARPAGPCAALAEHFPAITSVVRLANASQTGPTDVARVGFTCLQAGVSDLMTIEWIGSGIHIETVSGDTVAGYIKYFVGQPDFARSSVRTPPLTQAAAASGPRSARPGRPAVMQQGRQLREPPRQPRYPPPPR